MTSGRTAMERGEYAEAERLFRQQIVKTPQSVEAPSNLGAVLAHEDKFDETMAAYKKALIADPKLDAIYLEPGRCLLSRGTL